MEMDATVQTNATEQEVPRVGGKKTQRLLPGASSPHGYLQKHDVILMFDLKLSNSLFVMCHVYLSVAKPDVIVHLEE